MKNMWKKGTWSILFVFLLLLAISSVAQAANPKWQLLASSTKIKVGQDVTVEVRINDTPLIYGGDVHLAFDPMMFEVVDANNKQAGIQIEPGPFLNPAKSFSLEHKVNNQTGAIDYASTLLNPAPAVKGDGLLVRIKFQAKKEGEATIAITEGLLGTGTGETIAPDLSSVKVLIVGNERRTWTQANEGQNASLREVMLEDPTELPQSLFVLESKNILTWAGITGLGIIGISLFTVWLWRRRKQ
jgi:hypothetical protein